MKHTTICYCVEYKHFIAYYSSFEGFLRLKKLETLDLSNNGLNSSILPSLIGLTVLKTLNLGDNDMDNIFFAQRTICFYNLFMGKILQWSSISLGSLCFFISYLIF